MQYSFAGPRVNDSFSSRFVADVNVLDGTVMAPSTQFTKIWRLCNSGSLNWPRGTQLVWTGGDKFSRSVSVEVEVGEDFNFFNASLLDFCFLVFGNCISHFISF